MQLGGYKIHRKVAEGGMGEVYLASRSGIRGFAREVAIKRISPHLASHQDYVQMFLQEARIAALLDHPNVVQVHELVEQGGEYFLVMEYVEGMSLSRCLEAVGGPLPLPVAVQVAAQVAAGLRFVHDKLDERGRPLNLVHRDVSPPNILLSNQGAVKLTDFGIAKHRVANVLSQAGVIKGKYSYLAPEQVRGDPVDRRVDIYALGLVLYEMTVGFRAYRGEDAAVLSAVEGGRFTPPEHVRPGYPDDLRAVVMRALAYFPEERYPSCRELERDLVGLLTRRAVAPTPDIVASFISSRAELEEPFLEQASPPPLPPAMGNDTDPVRSRYTGRPLLRYQLLRLAQRGLAHARLHRRQLLLGGAAVVLLLASAAIFAWIGREPMKPLPVPAERVSPPDVALQNGLSQQEGASVDRTEPRPAAVPRVPRGRTGRGPAVASRKVLLITEPPCDVYLGRRRLGETPLRVALPRRQLVLSFVNPELGLRARRPLGPRAARLRLRFRQGKIVVRREPGLYVQIDGRMVGRTPVPPVPVYEGRHTVQIIDPFRHDRRSYRIRVREGATVAVP